MEFCSKCASKVTLSVPDGDNRERFVCDSCGEIHYQNPKNVVGCLLEWQGKVLLCKRSIEPRSGFWTLPAGFMENKETIIEGAAREAFEEATAVAENLKLFGIYNLPRISQVYIMFAGRLKDGKATAGEETLEVKLFDEDEIITESLQRFFERRDQRVQTVYLADIHSRPGQKIEIYRHN